MIILTDTPKGARRKFFSLFLLCFRYFFAAGELRPGRRMRGLAGGAGDVVCLLLGVVV